MPRLTRVVVLPVLRRHWALHAKRCPGAAPEKRNALERTYDSFVETAAKPSGASKSVTSGTESA